MKRYYTDPLAAAFMAKHFGMNLYCVYTKDDEGIEDSDIDQVYPFKHAMLDADMWGDVLSSGCRKIYIHPDSLSILEPQVGDLVESTRGTMGGISVGFLKSKQWIPAYGLPANFDLWTIVPRFGDGSPIGQHWAKPDEWQKIIQRNGIPFMWPECEEV